MSLLDHVPIVDKDQNGDGIERRAALRHADAPEDLPFARAVQLGRFDQRYRDTPHEFREQKYRERRERTGQQDGPLGVQDAEPVGHQIVRHERDLIGHEHQDHVEKEDGIAHLAAPAREAVGRDGRDHELRKDDRHGEDDGVPELIDVIRAFEQDRPILAERDFVRNEFQVDGFGDIAFAVLGVVEDLAVVGRDLALRHERVRDGEQRRHDEEEREQDGQQHDDRAGKIAFLFHPSTSFPKQFSIRNSSAIRITITIARKTAAADRR